jgi:hypothetical protein
VTDRKDCWGTPLPPLPSGVPPTSSALAALCESLEAEVEAQRQAGLAHLQRASAAEAELATLRARVEHLLVQCHDGDRVDATQVRRILSGQ